jgi:hypothetical protein
MRRALQILLAVGGATAIFISVLHIVLGPACIPGSVPVNATMDFEFAIASAAARWAIGSGPCIGIC